MYENITYALLLNRMLEKALSINNNLDTREGSLVWLGNAPAAVELQNLYIQLDTVLNETFADTASRDYLILRAAERGLSPYAATPAVLELSITPTSLYLPMNTRFSIGDLNYYVSADRGNGKYEITCETTGEAGNDYGATVIPIEYVDGLETCTITALLIPGEDEEDTEVFRQRYFNSLNAQAFGGNRIDYIEKVNAIPGVPEAVKSWLDTVYAAANNNKLTVGGTVKLVVIDSTFAEPSEPLVELVQTTIDPLQNAGEGVGIAPIGHVVKVYGVENETVNLSFTLTYQQEWGWEDVKTYVETTIKAYFTELAQTWADQEQPLVVRVSQIESRLLAVSGILDIADTKINGTEANYELALDHIPVLGTITPATGKQSA